MRRALHIHQPDTRRLISAIFQIRSLISQRAAVRTECWRPAIRQPRRAIRQINGFTAAHVEQAQRNQACFCPVAIRQPIAIGAEIIVVDAKPAECQLLSGLRILDFRQPDVLRPCCGWIEIRHADRLSRRVVHISGDDKGSQASKDNYENRDVELGESHQGIAATKRPGSFPWAHRSSRSAQGAAL